MVPSPTPASHQAAAIVTSGGLGGSPARPSHYPRKLCCLMVDIVGDPGSGTKGHWWPLYSLKGRERHKGGFGSYLHLCANMPPTKMPLCRMTRASLDLAALGGDEAR